MKSRSFAGCFGSVLGGGGGRLGWPGISEDD